MDGRSLLMKTDSKHNVDKKVTKGKIQEYDLFKRSEFTPVLPFIKCIKFSRRN